ncbi:MAG: polyprenyl synthetase family protein [Bacteroidetes bacterium]|nr:polyprenyl synthetase family protein [Bacteroidota bacterium]
MEFTEKKCRAIYERERTNIEKKLKSLLINKNPKSLYNPCSYILESKGKRLRAFLVLLSAKAVGARYSSVHNASLAVEILHNFTLVHDDIMDNANLRRGLPTVHIKYDLSTAILSGDNLIAIAYQNLLKDTKEKHKDVLSIFTQGIIEVCEGQSLDKEFETKSKVTIEEYLQMISKKTAALAEVCCSIGAILGGGSKTEISLLKNYGKNLGIAFQLQDDLLDVFGDEKEFGKIVGGDLREGKKTYLFLKALELSKGKDRAMLNSVIKNNGVKKSEVASYKKLYEKLKVIEITAEQVEIYTKKALNSAAKIKDEEAKALLIWLANSLTKRNK